MRTAPLIAALALVAATPVAAHSPQRAPAHAPAYGHSGGAYVGYRPYSYNGQRDRPGDYRCDAFWDANRTDCGAEWRDQRPYRTSSHRGWRYSHGYQQQNPSAPDVYPGAYGRPDLIYPGSGQTQGYGHVRYGHTNAGYGRDHDRIAWCRANYRSYDASTGYYRTYAGHLAYCG